MTINRLVRQSIGAFLLLSAAASGAAATPRVKEAAFPENTRSLCAANNELRALRDDRQATIRRLESELARELPLEPWSLVATELAFLHGEQGECQMIAEIARRALDKGAFLPFPVEGRRPSFIAKCREVEGFDEMLRKGERLRVEAQRNASAEYVVRLPASASQGRRHPLMMVFHGGFGGHLNLVCNWRSDRLDREFIVAYIQGRVVRGTALRSYGPTDVEDVREAYRQIIRKYPVDTERVILAGQSAGGALALKLAMQEAVPAAGLLLAFPVKPGSLAPPRIKAAADRDLRIALLTGENDAHFLSGQKEMGVVFDQQGLANRFVVFPELGHEFPPEFDHHIDTSLEFLLSKK